MERDRLGARGILGFLAIVGLPVVFGFLGGPGEMFVALMAGVAAAVFLNLDRIQLFRAKVPGELEVVMNEARAVVSEGQATLENLRELGMPLMLAVLEYLTTGGTWGGIPRDVKHSLRDDIERTAKSLGIDTDVRLQKAHESFFRHQTGSLLTVFLSAVHKLGELDEETKKRVYELKMDGYAENPPTKEAILAILGDGEQVLTDQAREHLEDYAYYLEHRTLRRQEVSVE